MAITIASGRITAIRNASPQAPTFSGGRARFACTPMHCEGVVQFNDSGADDRRQWRVGWVQAQWIETTWGNYRGQKVGDGSIFLQRARPPARPRQACRDTSGPVADIFTDPGDPREFSPIPAGPMPISVSVESNDPPGESYLLILQNSKAGNKPNFLQEVQVEFHFCTVLTVRDDSLNFHHQAHFYWNVHWQYRFHPQVFPSPTDAQWIATPVAKGIGAHHSHAIAGTPQDARFANVLTSAQVSSCVDIATAESNSPNVQEFPVWTDVDVRH